MTLEQMRLRVEFWYRLVREESYNVYWQNKPIDRLLRLIRIRDNATKLYYNARDKALQEWIDQKGK